MSDTQPERLTGRQLCRAYPQHFRHGADDFELIVTPEETDADARGLQLRIEAADLYYLRRDVPEGLPGRVAEIRRRFEAEVVYSSERGNLLTPGVVPLLVLHDLPEGPLRGRFDSLTPTRRLDLYLFALPGRYVFEPARAEVKS